MQGRTSNYSSGLLASKKNNIIQFLLYKGQQLFGDILMDEQSLGCVAYGYILGLSVFYKLNSHINICVFVRVGMTYAVSMAHNGNGGIVHYIFYELIGAARDDEVYIFAQGEHVLYILTCFPAG